MVSFGFCKDWAVENCTEPVFKMFRKPRNEQNKSRYFFLKGPVAVHSVVPRLKCDLLQGTCLGAPRHITP